MNYDDVVALLRLMGFQPVRRQPHYYTKELHLHRRIVYVARTKRHCRTYRVYLPTRNGRRRSSASVTIRWDDEDFTSQLRELLS